MGKTIAGPGRMGSVKAMKTSLKSKGNPNLRNIPAENSLTVRFLDEPEDFHGYYEHWMGDHPEPCVTDECEGCDSDDPEEQRRSFKYLANAYVVDDQKVMALKLPKSLVEMLMTYYQKYGGTLLDRDYELSRTGSGKNGTKYMAVPESPRPIKLSRFESKKHDLSKILSSMLGDSDDDDDDDEPPKKKGPKKSKDRPWDDEEPAPKKKKSASKKKPPTKSVVKKKSAVKRPVKKTIKRK